VRASAPEVSEVTFSTNFSAAESPALSTLPVSPVRTYSDFP
jgi:hypothetical protein